MRYFALDPEVAGGLGPKSIVDRSRHAPIVTSLHYEFQGWLGDEIVTSFPCMLVTERVAAALEAADLSGLRFDDVLVTKDPQFDMFFPDKAAALPRWRWLCPDGAPGASDLWQDNLADLIVSERALGVLSKFQIDNCGVEER